MNAIITPEDVSDFVSAKTLVIVREDLKNDALDILVFPDTRSRKLIEVLVVSAAVDS